MSRLKRPLFLTLAFVVLSLLGRAGVSPEGPAGLVDIPAEQLTSLNRADVEAQLGRALQPRERRQLRRARRLQKRHPEWSPRQSLDAVKPMNGLAVAGFVLSLVGFVIFELLIVGAVLGVIFSAIAMSQLKKNDNAQRGRGLAIAGLVLSIVGLLALVAIIGAG